MFAHLYRRIRSRDDCDIPRAPIKLPPPLPIFEFPLNLFIRGAESIKVWDAKNGALLSVFRELSHAELTCCILDNRQRKLFVGDSEGRIFTVNIKNGAKLKKFEKHDQAITDIQHWSSQNQTKGGEDDDFEKDDIRRVITASRENTVNIHDEDSQDSSKSCRYKMKQHKNSIHSISLKSYSELLASGSADGNIVLTNLVTYRQENLGKPSSEEVKQVLFLNPYHCLAASDSVGNIFFFGIAPSKIKNKLMLQKSYMTTPQTKVDAEKFPVTYFNFFNSDKLKLLLLVTDPPPLSARSSNKNRGTAVLLLSPPLFNSNPCIHAPPLLIPYSHTCTQHIG